MAAKPICKIKGKPTERKQVKSVTLPIKCRWNNCNQQFAGEWLLNAHTSEHLAAYLNSEFVGEVGAADNDEGGVLGCLWDCCKFRTDCTAEYQRHVYYHGYYQGLLEQGRRERDTNANLPACTKEELSGHIVPLMENDFMCCWGDCERTFLSIVEFQQHIVQHATYEYEVGKTPDDEKPKTECKWVLCKTLSDNKYRLLEHIKKHTLKKNLACCHCGELFRTKTTFYDHLRRQPENNTHEYQCAKCFKYFATGKLLRAHVVKHVNCFKCTKCDMTCYSADALATHIRYRHIQDKPFACSECDTRFVRKFDLVRHINMVHNKEELKCNEPGCEYSVRTAARMKRHLLEVHKDSPIIYVCHCCDKFFKNGKALSAHLKKVHEFELPSGHKRFKYRQDEDGYYRLETTRIESVEVTEEILKSSESAEVLDQESSSETITENHVYEVVAMPQTASGGNILIIDNNSNLSDNGVSSHMPRLS